MKKRNYEYINFYNKQTYKMISVRVSPDEYQKFNEIAEHFKLSRAELIKRYIKSLSKFLTNGEEKIEC